MSKPRTEKESGFMRRDSVLASCEDSEKLVVIWRGKAERVLLEGLVKSSYQDFQSKNCTQTAEPSDFKGPCEPAQ